MNTLVQLADMLNKLVQEVEEINVTTYSDTLEGVEGAFEMKAEKVVFAIAGLRRRALLMRQQMQLFRNRITTIENNAEWLRNYLLHGLEYTGRKRLETPAFTIKLRHDTAVRITDENDLPSQLLRVKHTEEPDKIAISKQLMAGETVPGAELEHRTSLTISAVDDEVLNDVLGEWEQISQEKENGIL